MINFYKGSLTLAIWGVYRGKAILHKATGANGAGIKSANKVF